MLEVKNLKKSFGDKKVLDDISFSLKEGECLGIVGQSGCGKSTLARIIARFIDTDDGHILFLFYIYIILWRTTEKLNKNKKSPF